MSSESAYALLTRTFQGVIMLVVGAAVIWRLSPEEQGYFFTFMSSSSLLQMGDLGLSYVVLHNANHLLSTGKESRLPGLFTRAFWLNCKISFVFATLVCLGGIQLLGLSQQALEQAHFGWYYPWITFVYSVFLAQLTAPGIAFVEGGISALSAWRLRFFQELLSGPIFISFLLYGFGLWSLTAFWLVRFALAAIWLLRKKPTTFGATSFTYKEWYQEVWPFQWKMGLSALSGYLSNQAMNPIVLAEQGSKIAGQFGFSLAITNMVLMVTTVWPISKAAQYSHLISTMQFKKLRRSFSLVTIRSTVFALCSALGISIILWWMTYLKLPLTERLADWFTTSALLAAAVVQHIIYCLAVLLRAERREPLLWVSIIGGLVKVMAVGLSAHFGGPHSIAATNLICDFAGILLVYSIFRRKIWFWQTNP